MWNSLAWSQVRGSTPTREKRWCGLQTPFIYLQPNLLRVLVSEMPIVHCGWGAVRAPPTFTEILMRRSARWPPLAGHSPWQQGFLPGPEPPCRPGWGRGLASASSSLPLTCPSGPLPRGSDTKWMSVARPSRAPALSSCLPEGLDSTCWGERDGERSDPGHSTLPHCEWSLA